jgi:hypothetical protein
LTVVGLGIQLIRQTTIETLEHLKSAERLLYLTPNPATEVWLEGLNPTAEGLSRFYAEGKSRLDTYEEMVARILSVVRQGEQVCVAVHGHPGVGVYAAHKAITIAREEGYEARMLPGISSEACLIADLGVDPVAVGWQSLEATDFVRRERTPDPTCGLLLWQPATVGVATAWPHLEPHVPGLEALAAVLGLYYPPDHTVIVYEAADYPVCDPVIVHTSVSEIPRSRITVTSTLYVPPLGRPLPRSGAKRAAASAAP